MAKITVVREGRHSSVPISPLRVRECKMTVQDQCQNQNHHHPRTNKDQIKVTKEMNRITVLVRHLTRGLIH